MNTVAEGLQVSTLRQAEDVAGNKVVGPFVGEQLRVKVESVDFVSTRADPIADQTDVNDYATISSDHVKP